MKKPLRLIALVALIGFEAVVAGLVLMPNVSDEYRAVYIERVSDCWPRKISGAVPMEERVSFLEAGAKGPAADLMLCGWIEPEDTGAWSMGPESRLLLVAPEPGPMRVELDLLPYLQPGHERQRVEIAANGEPVRTLELTAQSAGRQIIDIPAGLIGADGRIALSFKYPDAISPQALGISRDRRDLAIRLLSLRATQQVERGPA